MEDNYWRQQASVVDGKLGIDPERLESGEGVRWFYFNLKPDQAAQFGNLLTDKLNQAGVDWQFKMPKRLNSFDRPDAAVLYVNTENYQTVKQLVMEYAQGHPEAFASEVPAFTRQLRPGIAAAEETLQGEAGALPKNRSGQHSLGSSRSDIIADAIMKAPPGARKSQILELVRQRMRECGLDPDRPWLARAGNADDR